MRTLNTFMTLKITEVEVKHHLLAFEMRVVRGLYYPKPIKGYILEKHINIGYTPRVYWPLLTF